MTFFLFAAGFGVSWKGMAEEANKGWPIYLDPAERGIIDAAGEDVRPDDWHPNDGPAIRLCKCLEGLRDLEDTLGNLLAGSNKTKRRRRLRTVFVPLHSLCVGIVELLDLIQSEKSVHSRLPAGATATITALRTKFVTTVPFDRKGRLGQLRNKVSAHYEKSLSPVEMRNLLLGVEFTEVGEWINICLGVLCDLLKLDAYQWTATGRTPGTFVLMCQEPVMTVFQTTDGEMTGIEDFFMSKRSPKWEVFEVIEQVAGLADKLLSGIPRFE